MKKKSKKIDVFLFNGSLIVSAQAKWGSMKRIPESGFQANALLQYGKRRMYYNEGNHIKAIWKRILPKKRKK